MAEVAPLGIMVMAMVVVMSMVAMVMVPMVMVVMRMIMVNYMIPTSTTTGRTSQPSSSRASPATTLPSSTTVVTRLDTLSMWYTKVLHVILEHRWCLCLNSPWERSRTIVGAINRASKVRSKLPLCVTLLSKGLQSVMEGTGGINIGKDKFPSSLFSIATSLTNELQESFPCIILTDDWYIWLS